MKCEGRKLTAKELPAGDILEAGTAAEFETGSWRSERPIWHTETCIQCMICWVSCPDTAVVVKDGKMSGFNYEHCKGCGICARECPTKVKSITMEIEKK
jgi:pyruvate ferredoxin oxidoreductase delta subunit